MTTEVYDHDEQIKKAIEAGQRIHETLKTVDWKEISRKIYDKAVSEGTTRRIQQELKSI